MYTRVAPAALGWAAERSSTAEGAALARTGAPVPRASRTLATAWTHAVLYHRLQFLFPEHEFAAAPDDSASGVAANPNCHCNQFTDGYEPPVAQDLPVAEHPQGKNQCDCEPEQQRGREESPAPCGPAREYDCPD